MSNTPRNLTRNQLAEFLPNARAVQAFEQLLEQVSTLLPNDIATINRLIQETYLEAVSGTSKAQEALDLLGGAVQTASIEAGAADVKASQALDQLNRIATALELLSAAPAQRNDTSTFTDYIDFRDNGWVPAYKTARMWFGPTGTLELGMGNGNITQQVGEEFFRYGKASTAISDTDLQLVYKTGVVGASGVITFAPAVAGITDPDQILGIATESIALNAFGRVTTMGVVHGTNTTGSAYGEVWADNDDIWYNPTTGGLTKTKPSAPGIKLQVGTVINAGSGGSGSFSVKLGSSSSLGGTDSNVQLGALADKQLLQYDAAAGYWKNVDYSVTDVVAAETHAATSKATPVDADELPLADSASTFSLKKLTWANLKATLATWINGNLIAASLTSVTSSGRITSTLSNGGGSAAPFVSSHSVGCGYGWAVTGQGADGKNWDFVAASTVLTLRVVNDANSAAANALQVTRSGATVTAVDLHAGGAKRFGVTSAGTVTTGSHTVSGAFGCNGQAAQTAFTIGAAATDLASVITLANNIRTMCRNNGLAN